MKKLLTSQPNSQPDHWNEVCNFRGITVELNEHEYRF